MGQSKQVDDRDEQLKTFILDLTALKGEIQAAAPRVEARLTSIEQMLLSLQTRIASMEAATINLR